MDFAKGFFVLVMLSAGVLMAMGSNPRGMAQAQTADHETASHNSGTTAGETKQAKAHKPKPTNTVPGITYMLAGVTQRSDSDPYDQASPAMTIGPYWMIMWPFDPKTSGLPRTSLPASSSCGPERRTRMCT